LNIEDAIKAAATFAAMVFVLLLLISAVTLVIRRRKGRSRRERYPHLGRYFAIRVGIALGIGGAAFVLITAGLVLNSHRPPEDNSPAIRVDEAAGPVAVNLGMEDCGGPVDVTLTVAGTGARNAEVYSDQDGKRPLKLDRQGQASFELNDLTAKRGLLSCYIQLPLVRGGTGPTRVSLGLGDQMEVDTVASIPAPDQYTNGDWVWLCPEGDVCPSLATVNYAVEDGTKQVIVLVLAALFGSIIALFIGEALIEPVRQKFRGPERKP